MPPSTAKPRASVAVRHESTCMTTLKQLTAPRAELGKRFFILMSNQRKGPASLYTFGVVEKIHEMQKMSLKTTLPAERQFEQSQKSTTI